jgi:hypothetical protein
MIVVPQLSIWGNSCHGTFRNRDIRSRHRAEGQFPVRPGRSGTWFPMEVSICSLIFLSVPSASRMNPGLVRGCTVPEGFKKRRRRESRGHHRGYPIFRFRGPVGWHSARRSRQPPYNPGLSPSGHVSLPRRFRDGPASCPEHIGPRANEPWDYTLKIDIAAQSSKLPKRAFSFSFESFGIL